MRNKGVAVDPPLFNLYAESSIRCSTGNRSGFHGPADPTKHEHDSSVGCFEPGKVCPRGSAVGPIGTANQPEALSGCVPLPAVAASADLADAPGGPGAAG